MEFDMPRPKLTVATCQFPVTANIKANARHIRRQIGQAAARGADVAHFPENAITGNLKFNVHGDGTPPKKDWRNAWRTCDWELIRAETGSILQACRESGIWAVVGSSHSFDPEQRPTSCVYIFDPHGAIVDRYDKRRCSQSDLSNHTPGAHPVMFQINGISCGVTICLEWSFPDLFASYAKADVDLLFHSTFSAGGTQDTIHAHTIPQVMQGYGFTSNFFISVSNASNPRQNFPSFWVHRSGRAGDKCRRNTTGVLLSKIMDKPEKDELYGNIRSFRQACRDGSYYADHTSSDPRLLERQTLGP